MHHIATVSEQGALSHPANDVWWIRISAPAIAEKAKPGQFVMLKLFDRPHILGRPFSIAAVHENDIIVVYQVVGRITRLMSLLNEGEKIMIWGPLGKGFDIGFNAPLLLGGGVGLAPLLFAWQHLQNATLLMGFNDWQRFNRLALLLKSVGHIAPIIPAGPNSRLDIGNIYVTSQAPGWSAQSGLVLDPLNEENLKPHDALLACGPWPMLKATAALAAAHGLPCQGASEAPMACGVGACLGCAIPKAGGGFLSLCQAGPVLSSLNLDWERI